MMMAGQIVQGKILTSKKNKAGIIWPYFYICIDNGLDMWYNTGTLRKE